MNYSPITHRPLTFHDAHARFMEQTDTPRAYLEHCLNTIAAREPEVQAWASINESGAMEAAEASTDRYKKGKPLSAIDGVPVGIKDLIETRDLPTQMGCAAYDGNFPKRDSALVQALRQAGAIILGKTVTTALGFLDPGPTTNPFDATRTPGGSSSGSAAAVGAGMIPVAIGTQLVGSILRPASYCANWALKPTIGAINRGERLGMSQSHVGVHGNSATDIWQVATGIVKRVGGDPGHPGLYGPAETPLPRKPQRLVLFESEGWPRLDAASREVFESALDALQRKGIVIIRRRDSTLVEYFEQAISSATDLSMRLSAWEQRWSLENLMDQHPTTLGPSLLTQLETARNSSHDDYRRHLEERRHARQCLTALAGECDALISLASVGPAPISAEARKTAFPTGDVAFSCASSLLGAPAVTTPSLAVDGMPLGLQVMGQQHADADVVGIAQWLHATLTEAGP